MADTVSEASRKRRVTVAWGVTLLAAFAVGRYWSSLRGRDGGAWPPRGEGRGARTYDVRDLLMQGRDYDDAPELGVGVRQAASSQATASFKTQAQMFAEVAALVRRAADPDGNSGGLAAVEYRKGMLVLVADEAAHRRAEAAVAELRAKATRQVLI